MRALRQRGWVLLPIVASMATECDTTPRGVAPTATTGVVVTLRSVSANPPVPATAFDACLARWSVLGDENHVRGSWRTNAPVALVETELDVFSATFLYVPVGVVNTMTVHDQNECARNPSGDGHVTTGVTVNGTSITRVVGVSALAFELDKDGTVVPWSSSATP